VTASTVANYTSDDVSVATVTNSIVTANGTGSVNLTAEHAGLVDVVSLAVESASTGSSPRSRSGSSGGSSDEDERLSVDLKNGQADIEMDGDVLLLGIAFDDGDASGTVTVEPLDELPDDVDPPSDDAVAIAFVDVTVPSELADSPATVRLTLDATALDDVAPADLVIYHYHDGEWTALETTVVSTDGEIVLETTTPGFSLFAVATAGQTTSSDDGASTPADGSASGEGDSPTPRPGMTTPGEDVTSGSDDSSPSGEPGAFRPPTADVVLAVAIVLVALSLFAYRRRRP
jgi:PGF-pre-PGF domain-containing protein